MALLRGLYQLREKCGFTLSACHVNHGVRGMAADEDEAFVRKLCEELDIPFDVRRLSFKPGEKISEDELRRERYSAIRKACEMTGSKAVVLGHHADDQVETLLMRFIEGAGLRGLSGIAERSEMQQMIVLRPLISFSKNDIIAFLKDENISWREDHTNADLSYQRNRIRHELIPLIEKEYNPGFRNTMLRTSEHLQEVYSYIQREVEVVTEWNLRKYVDDDKILVEWISLDLISNVPEAVVSEIFRTCIQNLAGKNAPPRRSKTERLMKLVKTGKSGSVCRISGEITAFRDYENIYLANVELPRKADKKEILKALKYPLIEIQNYSIGWPCVWDTKTEAMIRKEDADKAACLPEGDCLLENIQIGDGNQLIDSYNKLKFPFIDKDFPVILRTRRPGDVILDKGFEIQLKKWFIDNKIPRPLRNHLLLPTHNNRILRAPRMDHDSSRQSEKFLIIDCC
mgnify:CR=1 FL=1